MILLLPLTRFKVEFDTASGRPHSRLEQLTLEALDQGAVTMGALQATFQIHQRLITQVVVNLIQDGYVAMGDDATYLLTELGEEIARGEPPRKESVAFGRSAPVVAERHLGLIAPAREVRFVGRREIERLTRRHIVPVRRHDLRLDQAQVRHLLPRGPSEWIRAVGEIRLLSRDAHFLPVRVDFETMSVVGIPDRWQQTLASPLLATARERTDEVGESPSEDEGWFDHDAAAGRSVRTPSTDELARVEVPTSGSRVRVVDLEGARSFFKRVLDTPSQELVVASPGLSSEGIGRWLPLLQAALGAGQHVSLIWGAGDQGIKVAGNLMYQHASGTLRMNRRATQRRLSCVAAIDAESCSVLIGDVDWFGEHESGTGGVVISEPQVVATVCQVLASAWRSSPGESLAAGPVRLQGLVGETEARHLLAPESAGDSLCAFSPVRRGRRNSPQRPRRAWSAEHSARLSPWA
jgi:hypothetical protein